MVGYMSTASTLPIQHVIRKEKLSDFPVSSGYDKLRFLKPVALGDTVTVIYEVIRIDKKKGRSIAENEVFNQRDELVPVGEHVMRWAKKLKGEETEGRVSGQNAHQGVLPRIIGWECGRTVIRSEGRHRKFVESIEQVCYSAAFARERGQTALYLTERAVFRLGDEGLELIEIAPT